MNLELPRIADKQPPLWEFKNSELTVAIASLSVGGAERIVLDWASRIYPKWKVHLIVLRDRPTEWPLPAHVRVTRLHGKLLVEQLKQVGKSLVADGISLCVSHLLKKRERYALAESGLCVIPVLHNAKDGWSEDASMLAGSPYVIAVSDACAKDLRVCGWDGYISVIRHIPPRREFDPEAREHYRKSWNIPQDAVVIGMIGAIKEQKNYPLALRILKTLCGTRDAYLVILGGPAADSGQLIWRSLVNDIHQMDLRKRVAMPGFVPNASKCLSAFDVILNTSKFEGLSMATLEALASQLPVVASRVGGQGEINHEGLRLISGDASEDYWASALVKAIGGLKPSIPSWVNFPAFRLWTLAALAHQVNPTNKTLFITANLNSGGAQRSLVNLAKNLKNKVDFEILVTGNSTAEYFYKELRDADVGVWRAGDVWNTFDFAEAIVAKVIDGRFGTICFWNVDARIKLLSVKALAFSDIKFVDVSPGDSLFDEMGSTREFQNLVSFSQEAYYARLNKLVLKYDGLRPAECIGKSVVIPNGVNRPLRIKTSYEIGRVPRIAVNGRIAPTKFICEIIEAVRIVWREIPAAELHVYGAAEQFHDEYAKNVFRSAGSELNQRIFFHGLDFEAVHKFPDFDAYIVIGENQGCPNALLEAMSVGLPSIANNDGGTSEQLFHEQTGLLLDSRDPCELASALIRILSDRDLAERLGVNGRNHVLKSFSVDQMVEKYVGVLN